MSPVPTTLFLCGDVMSGRGVDQILAHPGDPRLHEPFVSSAKVYVALAERASGEIPRAVEPGYVWGDALAELGRVAPAARIANLETAVTKTGEPWPGKGVHYRMHPENLPCLAAAGIDCWVLANNHVLDWGRDGLADTLNALRQAGMRTAGAGGNADEAEGPAILECGGSRRVLVFACATTDSGVPSEWVAGASRSGVNVLQEVSERGADAIANRVRAVARDDDLVVLSIHWGGNWGYRVHRRERAFAHRLIDSGAVHVVHGHSSHHPRPIEVYRDRLILYGCGDLINDYEGIGGHEAYRSELVLLYFATVDAVQGRLLSLRLVPLRIRRFRLERAGEADARWLADVLERESGVFGTRVRCDADGRIEVEWRGAA